MRIVSCLLVAASLTLAGTAAVSAPCKDAKGKFVKCPPAKAVPCKDAKGKFVKCGAPGAKPIR